ncbi:ATP-dependent Clp protease ATP-binding subunit [bacterium]|nr:ATP-dependent Clp protease ATP-binding subunit [bacterium]
MQGITQSSNSKKPKGILFFVGPTGVGKTEISKALCEYIFGDESRLIRFDMSEYNHEESDQKLIGAAPGYIGYDAGGQLTNAVKEKPFCILLFDEIEKAHNKILDKFLQILEDGRLTSSQGETIDFSETLIIFTSNIGTSEIKDPVGDKDIIHNQFISAVKKYFNENLKRPEILNRIGEKNIIPFDFITDDNILDEILDMKLRKIITKLKEEKFINLNINKVDKEFLFEQIKNKYDKAMGGRGLMERLETNFIDDLSEFIFANYELISENKKNKIFTQITSK